MNEAAATLALSYTYDIIRVPQEKRDARVRLGKMAAQIAESVADEIMDAAVFRWCQYRGVNYDALIQAGFKSSGEGGHFDQTSTINNPHDAQEKAEKVEDVGELSSSDERARPVVSRASTPAKRGVRHFGVP